MPNLANRRMVDPVLSTIAQGYTSPEHVGTRLLPVVTVSKEGGKVPRFGKEAFAAYRTERAPRTRSARVEFDTQPIEFVLEQHSVEVPLDDREIDEGADVLDLEAAQAEIAQEIISRSLERSIAQLVSNADEYPAGNKLALSGNDRWSSHAEAASNPFADVANAKEAVRAKVGQRPNVMLVGAQVWAALEQHPKLLDRIKYTQMGVVTTELAARAFAVDELLVGDDVTASQSGAFSDIWGNICILAVRPSQRANMGVPAFGYVLRKRGYPTSRRYFEDDSNSHIVQNQDIWQPRILGPDAGFLFTSVVA